MARGINKVILVGTLGKDPDMKYAANGNAIANISVATSEQWNDKSSGQRQEKTEWHRVVIFGKLAEVAGQYLKKGSQVYLEGKLQTRKWQDTNTGQDRYSTEVVLSGFDGTMEMLGGGGGRGDAPFSGGDQGMNQSAPQGGGFGGQQAPAQRPMQNQSPAQAQPPGQQQAQYGQNNQASQQGGFGQTQQPQQQGRQQQSPMQQAPAYSPNDFDDDDVPF